MNNLTSNSGTFGDVEYVLLVGVCGGVPHYTDYYNHVRLGDVIVSMPNKKQQVRSTKIGFNIDENIFQKY